MPDIVPAIDETCKNFDIFVDLAVFILRRL
jgi:hypothetical protein